MIKGIIIGVLALGIAGTAFWGYQERQQKNAVAMNAENNYQRAFHDLSYQMDLLHDKLGTTLAMNSRSSLSPSLADVWRISSQAHSDVGQLPLALLPFNKTQEYLANVGNFSYQTAVRDLDKHPLSAGEYQQLQTLYKQSGDIQNQLRKVQHQVLKNNLRWMDVQMALFSGKEKSDNQIIDGFKTVEKTVSGYSETDTGPTFIGMQKNDDTYNNLQGKAISADDAVKIAEKYMQLGRNAKITVTKNRKGSSYPFYSINAQSNGGGQEASMDITKKGGYPLWFMNNRHIGKQKISLHEAGLRAEAYLKMTGFKNLEMLDSAQYDNIGIFDFVTVQNHVRIYPESIKVKVALDNGSINGFSAQDYLKMHHDRPLPVPKVSLEQARAKVNPNFKVMETYQSIILNNLNQEVLCYELLGTIGEDTYRIFINADNGNEEKVQKLKNSEELHQGAV